MASYSYNGFDKGGHQINGAIDAVDRKSAITELTSRGFFVSNLFAGSKNPSETAGAKSLLSLLKIGSGRVTGKDIVAITTQLSTALRAGLEIINAIKIIASQQHKPAVKEVLDSLAEGVSGGRSLSDMLAEHPKIFSKLYISMVRVGETGGILEQTMTQLADLLKRDEKVKSGMKNAAAYPIFVLTVGLISVVIVLTKILPKIIETLDVGVSALPLPTQMLLGISDFLLSYGFLVLAGLIVFFYAFAKWKNTDSGRYSWDSFKLKIPVLGSVLRTIAVARFARTLGALSTCGITILYALSVVRDTLANEVLGRDIDEVAAKVKVGESIAEPLAKTGNFPPLLVQIVSVGEQTGKLDELLLNAADTFDEESDSALKKFTAVFPAVLIMLLAVVVGFIIAATLLPIMSLDLGGVGL